jgi:hypothetical protein
LVNFDSTIEKSPHLPLILKFPIHPQFYLILKMLKKTFYLLSLASASTLFTLPAIAKPLNGTYWPFASDVSIQIKNNRFREGTGLEGGAGEWQTLSNLKEIKKGIIYYISKGSPKGMYYCHKSLWPVKGGAYSCTKTGVKPDKL